MAPLWLIILLPFLALFLAFRTKRASAIQAISNTFQNTEYQQYIPWIIARSKHETDSFKSRLFREQNNLVGMKEAQRRQTTDIDEGTFSAQGGRFNADSIGFSEYKSLSDSAEDLLLWMRAVRFPTNYQTIDSFVGGLKSKSYFEDTLINYQNGVKRFV